MSNTLETIAEYIAKALLPLLEALEVDDDILGLVEELGYVLPSVPPSLKNLQSASEDTLSTLNLLEEAQEALVDGEGSEENLLIAFGALALNVTILVMAIHDLDDQLRTELPSDFVSATNIADDFEERLLNRALSEAITDTLPLLHAILFLLGVVDVVFHEEDVSKHQPEFELYQIYWERFLQALTDPAALFRDVYGWGSPELDVERLFEAIEGISFQLLTVPEVDYPDNDFIAAVAPGVIIPAEEGPEPQLLVPILDSDLIDFSILVYPLPTASASEAQGLAITLVADGTVSETIPLAQNLSLLIESSINLNSGLALALRPDQPIAVMSNVLDAGTVSQIVTGRVSLKLQYASGLENDPLTLLSIPGGSRLEVGQLYLSSGVGMGANNSLDFFVEAGLLDGRFILSAAESDGFLANILPEDGFQAAFELIVGWAHDEGLYFQGSATLEINLPTHISIGPIEIQGLYIIIPITGDEIPIEISSAISANLGPLKATVERLGVKAAFQITGNGGNLGPLDLQLGFKPPNGVGLAVDAEVVKGGGYLFFDFDKEEYAGALELVFSGFLTLKAIGLITTRLPDGSKGFSLLIIITAEFGTGFQLGFGFVLLGVGGLLGLNRTMKLEPLTEGVRTGAIESVMFPKDVIENAPRIISDLRKFFPPEEGIFLIGPLAKLGWGTPALITLSLGIIFEIPGNIAILGVLKVVLPDEKAPLLVLQVAFIGAIEFDKQRAYFFAGIFESRVLFITLEGEMGVLVAWGDAADFVVSLGGFHPQFTPPPLPFPSPKRVSLNILNESWGRIRVMGYFAVTSNTVQLGARAELFFGFSEFKIEGHLAFDALFQFDPFFFIIEISCGVSLKVFGIGLFSISLKFSLEGPTPWRAKGYGKLKILFFSIKANFDFTWGEKKDTSLPPIEVLPLLVGELEKLSNWKAQLPASSHLLVSLRKLEEEAEALVLHPVGTLTVTQRAVPLDLRLDKVGNQKPSDGKRFYLDVASGLTKVGDREEPFAIAQFQDFKDAEKLSQAPFQPEDAGLELAVSDQSFATGKAVKRNIRYETHIIDTDFQFVFIALFNFVNRLFTHFLNGSVVTKSVVSQHYRRQFQPFEEKIVIKAEQFVVASTVNNQAVSRQAVFNSEAKAHEFMQAEIARGASRRDLLHVIPADEVSQ